MSSGIAITGGLASGKSTIAEILRSLGQTVFNADQLAREVVEPGTPGLAEIVKEFGEGVLNPRGELDRTRLRDQVFGDAEKRARLEGILHPRIQNLLKEKLARADLNTPEAIWFYEIPLLFETGGENRFRAVWLAACPEAVQVQRAMTRDGITKEQALKIMASQWPLERKAAKADVIFDTTKSKDQLTKEIKNLVAQLTQRT
jgi:dephospho-CoA kinase